jgi:hypothetical protein
LFHDPTDKQPQPNNKLIYSRMHSFFIHFAMGAKTGSTDLPHKSKSPITQTAKQNWPLFIRAIAKFRKPADLGIGDTTVHLIGDTRSMKFKKWFQKKFGTNCGCTERQAWLNRRYPYA